MFKSSKILLGLFSLNLLLIVPVWALPPNALSTTYYNDAKHTKVVGHQTLTCTGQVKRQGRTSGYSATVVIYPCGGKPLGGGKVPCDLRLDNTCRSISSRDE